MRVGTITIEQHRPSLGERIRWYALQTWLRATKPLWAEMTADEWYAADCPPYAGQRAPWNLP